VRCCWWRWAGRFSTRLRRAFTGDSCALVVWVHTNVICRPLKRTQLKWVLVPPLTWRAKIWRPLCGLKRQDRAFHKLVACQAKGHPHRVDLEPKQSVLRLMPRAPKTRRKRPALAQDDKVVCMNSARAMRTQRASLIDCEDDGTSVLAKALRVDVDDDVTAWNALFVGVCEHRAEGGVQVFT